MKIKEASKKKLMLMAVILLYVVVLLPYMITIFYSLPSADDFGVGVGRPYFINALRAANGSWLTWGGGWFYALIQNLFNPKNYAEAGSRMLGIYLLISFAAFILCFSFVNIAALTCLFGIKEKKTVAVMNIFLIALLLFTDNYCEIFYWYTGNTYLSCMTFALAAIAVMILYFSKMENKWLIYILMILFGMIGCNMTCSCVTVGAAYCLIAGLMLKEEKRRPGLKEIAPLVLYIIVGCLTVFAPGNFVRRAAGGADQGPGIIGIARLCIGYCCERLESLMRNGVLVFMLLGLFAAGLIIGARLKSQSVGENPHPESLPDRVKLLWTALPLGIINLFGTAFPVTLGYRGGDIFVNRICFLMDFHVIVSMAFFLLWGGLVLAEKTALRFNPKISLLTGILLFGFFYSFVVKDGDYKMCEWDNQVRHLGLVRAENRMWNEIFDEIREAGDEDVVITVPKSEYIVSGVLYPPRISDNPDYWVSQSAASYFGKNSLCVRSE